jgi:TIR domain
VGTVFLSHRRTEQADAEAIARRLGDRWRIVTLPVRPAAWQDAYRELVSRADAVVCIVGERTAESPNVGWELETALELGRPLLAVRSAAAPAPRLPAPLAARRIPLIEADDVAARLAEAVYERAG